MEVVSIEDRKGLEVIAELISSHNAVAKVPATDDEIMDWIEAQLNSDHAAMLAAFEEGKPVGYILLMMQQHINKRVLKIMQIYARAWGVLAALKPHVMELARVGYCDVIQGITVRNPEAMIRTIGEKDASVVGYLIEYPMPDASHNGTIDDGSRN